MTTSTRSDHRTRFTGVLVLAVLLLLGTTACIPGTKRADPTMTPDQATQKMIQTLTAVMQEVVPGFKLGQLTQKIVCGGLVGTDDSKVFASVHARIAAPMPADIMAKLAKALRKHGIKVDPGHQGGDSFLPFEHPAFSGSMLLYNDGTGTGTIGADTACLKNPDRS